MKKSKLIEVLSTFTKEDLKSFQDFISSPFFNKKKELIPFFLTIAKFHPFYPKDKIDRKRIFKLLYPKQAYNEKRLGYLMSYLTKLSEQYISFQQYQSDEMMSDYYLLTAFLERDLFKYYRQENKKVACVLEEQKKSSHTLLKKYLISKVANHYVFLQRQRKQNPSLQIVSDQLDLFYLTTKLEYSCEMMNRKNVLGADYQFHLLQHLESALDDETILQDSLTKIYLQIYRMQKTEVTTEKIGTLRSLIQSESEYFSSKETRNIYMYLINFCIQMLRKGKVEFMEQALDLYLDGIKQRIFYENDHLSPWVYTNVIRAGSALKRYEFTKEFIYKYNEDLPIEFRENALHYNLAELYYSTKEFDQAIDHLNQVRFTEIQIHLGSREMLLKIYFETDAEEALLSLIASFSIFLKRNKNLSAQLKRPYLNFCDLLNQVMRRNPKKLPAIRTKIETTNPMTSRTWLLGVCDKIIKEVC